jgi:hypothetical protein
MIYDIVSDEGSFFIETDASRETIIVAIELLKLQDSYDYDQLIDILNTLYPNTRQIKPIQING